MKLQIVKIGNKGSDFFPENIACIDKTSNRFLWAFQEKEVHRDTWIWLDQIARYDDCKSIAIEETKRALTDLLLRAGEKAWQVKVLDVYIAAEEYYIQQSAAGLPLWLRQRVLDSAGIAVSNTINLQGEYTF